MRRLALSSLLLLSAGRASAAETIYVDDPLTAPPKAAVAGVVVGSQGGSFGPSGWTTTGDDDAIWFLVPASLPTARVEVSVKGISTATLDGEEHDLIVTYGDTDRTEPVDYMPAYRNNNFKTNLRIFGALSPGAGGRPQGANKLELRLCPAGFPGYSDTCPAGCTDYFEVAYLGAVDAIPWDAATNYRMKVAWSPGSIGYTRGGPEPEAKLSYPGTLAPKALRVRIGSPRHGVGSVNRMPKGLTFSNVLIAGVPGAATPVCGGTVADAGVDAAGCDKPISVEPLTVVGSGPSRVARVAYRHCAGAAAFRIVQFWIGDGVDPAIPSLSGGYEGGRLFVGGESCAPGEAKTLSSPHGSLDCARTKVVTDGERVIVDWALQPSAALSAVPRPFFVDAKGGTPEARLGWTNIGTWGDPKPAPDAGDVVEDDASSSWDGATSDARGSNNIDQDLGGGELPCSCSSPGRETRAPWSLALAGFIAALRGSCRRWRRG